MRITAALFIASAVLLASPVFSIAEEDHMEKQRDEQMEKQMEKQAEEKYPSWDMDAGVRYEPSRGAKAQSGDVEIIRSDYTFNYDFKAFDKLPVELSLYNRYTGINNTVTDVHLPSRLVELTGGIETTLPFFNVDKTYFRIDLEPGFYSDSWEFTGSNFRMCTNLYAIYLPNPKWTFLCGLAVAPETQDPFFPILGFIYKPNDRLTFYIAPRRPNITYKLTDHLSIFTEGSFSLNDEYIVKYDNNRDATLRYYESYLGGGIGYRPNKFIEATLSVGESFRRRLTYDDSLGKINIKDGMYTQFRVIITP